MVKIIRRNSEDLAEAAAKIFVTASRKLLKEKDEIVICIPGGRSVTEMWKRLAAKTRMPWEKVQIFMADERIVPPNHEDSNFKLAYDMFLGKLIHRELLSKDNVHIFIPENSKDRGSVKYTEEFNRFGGKCDILILGVGEDGHVGALYPNHSSIKSRASGYITMDDSPKPPADRITLTKKTMLTADVVILLFVGEAKRNAFNKFSDGDNLIECPARLAKQINDCFVLTDLG